MRYVVLIVGVLIGAMGCGRTPLGSPVPEPTIPPADPGAIAALRGQSHVRSAPAGTQEIELNWDTVADATYTLYLATDPILAPDNYTTLENGEKRLDVGDPPIFLSPPASTGVVYFRIAPVVSGTEQAVSGTIGVTLLGVGADGLVPLPQPAWSQGGVTSQSAFGYPVQFGDLNGDGIADLLVGAQRYNNSMGRAYVFRGGPNGLATQGQAVENPAAEVDSHFGAGLAVVGDVTNDNIADVLLGAPDYNAGSQGQGRAWIFLGGATVGDPAMAAPTPSWDRESSNNAEYMGRFGAALGDIDDDGFNDWAVSRHEYSQATANGRVSIYRGDDAGDLTDRNATQDITRTSGDNGANFGWGLAPVPGDTDGDGSLELLIGARFSGAMDVGRVFLYDSDTQPFANPVEIFSGDVGSHFGYSVSFCGDLNGDGADEMLVGAPDRNNDSGRASLYFGQMGVGPDTGTPWTTDIGEATGEATAGLGDVNGDGYDDFAIGAPRTPNGGLNNAGAAYLWLGQATAPTQEPSWTVEGESASGYFGGTIAAGDINDDGAPDIAVGVTGFNGVQFGGLYIDRDTHVYYGPPRASPAFDLVTAVSGAIDTPITMIAEFTDTAAFPEDLSKVHECEIDWGDGVIEGAQCSELSPGRYQLTRTHVYFEAKEHLVRFTAKNAYDDFGVAAQAITKITISE